MKSKEMEVIVPFGRGIAGSVAETKQSINIKDAYSVSGKYHSNSFNHTEHEMQSLTFCLPSKEHNIKRDFNLYTNCSQCAGCENSKGNFMFLTWYPLLRCFLYNIISNIIQCSLSGYSCNLAKRQGYKIECLSRPEVSNNDAPHITWSVTKVK